MNAPVLIVVAHPDDETLAFSHVMQAARDCVIVHVTDGSPLNLRYARDAGFDSREAYAQAPCAELECALVLLGGARRGRSD